uniref:Uncharacterized protein n=1 Tax=Fundidesulfovibrio putealis TaxID=270496 RepID=A0A7C4AC10_9BACT
MTDPTVSEIEALQAEIADFQAQLEQTAKSIRDLRDAEDVAKGVFHAEAIHAAQQDRLRLEFEIQYRKARITRLRFG